MEEGKMMIPYVVYESEQARNERNVKRLVTALIVAAVAIFISNAMWLWYLSGYDIETYDYMQDGAGVNIIGDRNGVRYDVPEIESEENDTEE